MSEHEHPALTALREEVMRAYWGGLPRGGGHGPDMYARTAAEIRKLIEENKMLRMRTKLICADVRAIAQRAVLAMRIVKRLDGEEEHDEPV